MATVTRTYKEDYGSGWYSTWTGVFTSSDISVTGDTFTFASPNITAKYVKPSGSNKGYAETSGRLSITADTKYVGSFEYEANVSGTTVLNKWASNVTKTYTKKGTHAKACNTSDYFTSANATKRTLVCRAAILFNFVSAADAYCNSDVGYYTANENINVLNITLNAPPTFTNDPMTFDTQGIYAGVTSASVHVDDITAYYGGYIKEAKLTIGNQTAVLTGDDTDILDECILSIQLNSVGTFTPVLTITDSRDQIKTVNLPDITVSAGDDTTFISTQVSSDTPGFYAGVSTASVTVSDISVPYGGSAAASKLVIGNQEISGSGAGTLQIALDSIGTFTPMVSVTDSWGRTYSKTLDPIIVNEYLSPGITIDVDRAASDGTVDEESTTHILVTMPFTYTRDVATFLQPTLKLGVQEQTSNVTWYESWDSVNGVSDPISSWTNYHPASPETLYALVSGTFQLANTYEVSITAHDSRGKNSEEIAQKVPIAFFTMDFLAGGHGIAFGKLATQTDLFECDLDAQFNGDVDAGGDMSVAGDVSANGKMFCADNAGTVRAIMDIMRPVGSTYETVDANFDPNVTWGGTWELLPEGTIILAGSESGTYQVGTDTSTGSGYKEYGSNTHTLSMNEMPSHNHNSRSLTGTFRVMAWHNTSVSGIVSKSSQDKNKNPSNGGNEGACTYTVNATHTHDSQGGGQAHSIMQKSIAMYIWIRTA